MGKVATIMQIYEDFFESEDYSAICEKTYTYRDEAELMADDSNYFDSIGAYKMVEINYKGIDGFIPMYCDIDISSGQYVQTLKGMRYEIDSLNFGLSILKAFGMKGDDSFAEAIVKEIKNDAQSDALKEMFATLDEKAVQAGYIAPGGVRLFYDELMQHCYLTLYNKFGNPGTGTGTECIYEATQRTYPTGQSTLVNWDNSKFDEVSTAIGYTNQSNYMAYPYDKIYEQLQNFAETDDDVKAVLQCSNVRTYVHGTNDWIHYSICGWTLENNTIVTTDHGDYQDYGLTVTSMKWVRFTSSKTWVYQDPPIWPTFTVYQKGTWTGSQGITINNKKSNYGWLNAAGFPRQMAGPGGIETTFYYWDSMGFVGDVKPYEVIGSTPSARPMAEQYTTWITDDGDWPVGEGDDQGTVWRGILPEKNPIGTWPVPGVPSTRIPDPESDDVTPDIDGVQGVYGLFTVYKLNFNHLLRLGNWLWDADVVDQLKRMFTNNPLEAVISLHQIYMDPTTYTDATIKLGYVDTKISSASPDGTGAKVRAINDRYQTVHCGYATVPKYFFDIRDYQTKVSIYLPFIGIKELDINEVLGCKIEIDYQVDVFTGDCTATLMVNRGSLRDNKVLYVFQGNCASQLPLTASDKSRLFGNIANLGMSAVSAVATKGASLGGLFGAAANTMLGHNIQIEKAGTLTGNFGAMGYKQPYFIIERPQPADAIDRQKYIGKPCNVTVQINRVKGYAQFDGMHVDTIANATDSEKAQIEALLQQGIII